MDHGFGTGNRNDTSCGESKRDDDGLGKHLDVGLIMGMNLSGSLFLKRPYLAERAIVVVVVACYPEMRMEEYKTSMRDHLRR